VDSIIPCLTGRIYKIIFQNGSMLALMKKYGFSVNLNRRNRHSPQMVGSNRYVFIFLKIIS
jgi:hypothetical protein